MKSLVTIGILCNSTADRDEWGVYTRAREFIDYFFSIFLIVLVITVLSLLIFVFVTYTNLAFDQRRKQRDEEI